MHRRLGFWGGIAALALVVALGVWLVAGERLGPELSPKRVIGAVTSPVSIGGPFQLVDQHGQAVTEATFRGSYLLIYFGYTFCPDACPTALGAMSGALDRLGKDAARIRPLFITVDPERDTPAVLASYAGHFHPRLVALTGTPERIKSVAQAYRVYYAKTAQKDGPYLIDHTSLIYVMDPQGNYLAMLRHTATPDELAERLRALIGAAR